MKIYVSIVNRTSDPSLTSLALVTTRPTGCVLNSNTILAFNKTNTHDVQSMYQIN